MIPTTKYETQIERQFDSFCKAVLRNQARKVYAEKKRWNDRFISLEALTPLQLDELSSCDTYDVESACFLVDQYKIAIADLVIAHAIAELSKRQQDVILLMFFLDMTEEDIATLLNLAKSTVHYHKSKALEQLRQRLEEA